jgi:hypothetical protein
MRRIACSEVLSDTRAAPNAAYVLPQMKWRLKLIMPVRYVEEILNMGILCAGFQLCFDAIDVDLSLVLDIKKPPVLCDGVYIKCCFIPFSIPS